MREIDDMDLLYYLRVLAHEARGGADAPNLTGGGHAYIDDVWPM